MLGPFVAIVGSMLGPFQADADSMFALYLVYKRSMSPLYSSQKKYVYLSQNILTVDIRFLMWNYFDGILFWSN